MVNCGKTLEMNSVSTKIFASHIERIELFKEVTQLLDYNKAIESDWKLWGPQHSYNVRNAIKLDVYERNFVKTVTLDEIILDRTIP